MACSRRTPSPAHTSCWRPRTTAARPSSPCSTRRQTTSTAPSTDFDGPSSSRERSARTSRCASAAAAACASSSTPPSPKTCTRCSSAAASRWRRRCRTRPARLRSSSSTGSTSRLESRRQPGSSAWGGTFGKDAPGAPVRLGAGFQARASVRGRLRGDVRRQPMAAGGSTASRGGSRYCLLGSFSAFV